MNLPLRLRAWAARRLADPAFQRRATRLPLTRAVARRHARNLFGLASGFVHSQLLACCLRLGLLDALQDGPATLPALAARLAVDPDRLTRLIDAAAPLGLVWRRGEQVVLGSAGAALLGNPAARAMIEHHDALYRDLADPERLVRGGGADGGAHAATDAVAGRSSVSDGRGRVAALWGYAGASTPERLAAAEVAGYSALMTRSQGLVADEILAAVPLASRRVLLDVGGGEGAFAAAALRRHPDLRAMVFDLPAVADEARRRLAAQGLAARACAYGGSFLHDRLPEGADVVSLVRVVHDHDDAPALALLRAARAALPAGGLLVVAEPMAGAEPLVDAYFGAYFLSMGQGRLRSVPELDALLTQAGFQRVQEPRTRMPLLVRVVTAQAAAP